MGFGSFGTEVKHFNFYGILLFCVFCVSPTVSSANSEPQIAEVSSASTATLQNALRKLNTTLAYYDDGLVWRRDLMLNILEAQTAKGEQADINLLRQIHEKFVSDAADIDDPAFTDVRDALKDQIALLVAAQFVDLSTALVDARGQYRQITIDDMSSQRDFARDELLRLKAYYRKTMLSRDRANLFYDLKLNEAIEFLDTIEFELAPEVSVGKLTSMIRDVEQQLKAVILEIDAIPIDSEQAAEKNDPSKPETKSGDEEKTQDESPTPDQDQRSMAELQQEKSKLQAQIQKLKDQRTDVRAADAPRRNKRIRIGSKLREFELNFVEISKERGDPYFVSATLAFERFVRTYLSGTSDNLQEEFLTRLATLENDLLLLAGPDQAPLRPKLVIHLNGWRTPTRFRKSWPPSGRNIRSPTPISVFLPN